MVIAEAAGFTTLGTLVQFRPAGVDFQIQTLVAPFAGSALGIIFTNAGTLCGTPYRGIAFSHTALVVESAALPHQSRTLGRAETGLASTCLTLFGVGTE